MNKRLALFFLIMFVVGTDTFLISPLIPTLQKQFHISTELSGWMMGAYALGYALFALIAGPLSDGWDRKKVMIAGMVCFSAATILCGFATSFWTMFLFRFLAGVSAAFASPQVWAAIPALFPPNKIAKAFGITTAGLAVSQALGVPIGSWLAVTNWSYPFFVIGAGSLLLALLIAFIVPELKPAQDAGAPSSLFGRYVPLIKSGTARGAFLAYFLFQFGNFAAFTFIGKWLTDRFGISVGAVGGVIVFLGLGNLVGSFGSAAIINKFNRFNTMAGAILLLIVCFLVLPHLPALAAVAAVYLIIFAVLGTIFPLMMGMLISLNPAVRGTISSLANSVMYGATTAGAWVAGLLYALFNGFAAVGLMTAVSMGASLLVFMASGVLAVQGAPKEAAKLNNNKA
ncbi:MFS transporter [Paenibacillus beijingensis]|uniref:MFS transporter n=1 Tax=Paenibacillus beijingensis TaxID=1126833 RepID=A0A0D5NH06_9BACL|nr:MFS transporter [Paenibacillus beijingensis]AJY74654.1 MFS transporter [Paenibacillus beijingensis]